jgi:hypothetical protein
MTLLDRVIRGASKILDWPTELAVGLGVEVSVRVSGLAPRVGSPVSPLGEFGLTLGASEHGVL